MIARLTYVSRPASGTTATDVRDVLAQARARNALLGVTGFLLYLKDAFVQVLEGPPHTLTELFAKIARDPRHDDVVLVECHRVDERRFGAWTMGFAVLDPDARQRLRLTIGSAFVWTELTHHEIVEILADCAASTAAADALPT